MNYKKVFKGMKFRIGASKTRKTKKEGYNLETPIIVTNS